MTSTNVLTVDDNNNLIFDLPLKMADFDIQPSNGGVLMDGSVYGGDPSAYGPLGIPTAKEYTAIKVSLQSNFTVGNGDVVNVGFDFSNYPGGHKRYFVYFDPVDRVLQGTDLFLDVINYKLVFKNVADTTNPGYRIEFYTNAYSTDSLIIAVDTVANASANTITYTLNIDFSEIQYSPVDSWMKPGDCGFFFELIPS